MDKKAIHFIVVNYRNDSETQAFLDQLRSVRGLSSVFVHVVDNTDGRSGGASSFPWAVEGYPTSIRIHEPGRNLGYMGAAEFVWESLLISEAAAGLGSQADAVVGAGLRESAAVAVPDFSWFILANSDLELADDFFEVLLRQPLSDGLIGPSLFSPLSGGETNPYLVERPSVEKMRKIAGIFSRLWVSRIYQYLGLGKKLLRRFASARETGLGSAVYAVHGAIMIFSRSYFVAGGTLRMPCFLFNEEIFAAETCRELGLSVRFVPELRVVHREHGSMGWNFSDQILRYKREASRVIYERYFRSADSAGR